ncbi:MAG TPA: alpha-L-rhamnosidase C-terminal domain-containing protein, partial [Planctomycetota bacterium]|nr:alpha-L-rhamnosidase C-terminal domain-containing protein [Planctomycetota bacterium]
TVRDSFMPHRLVPRLIPHMEQRPTRFERVHRGPPEWTRLIHGKGEVTIPANSSVDVTLAIDGYTTACPHVRWSGGSGARIRLTYDEALRLNGVKQRGPNADGEVKGVYDEITCDNGGEREWESWHYRAFRFARVQVTTAAEPLTLHDLSLTFWAYPYKLNARFESDDAFHSKLFNVAFHTMRMCSHEVVEDCPYYEQLCYVGDFTVQNQIAAYTTGDYSLARQGLLMFNWSRHAEEGLTASRYPCRMPQIIPGFSQFYIMGVHDLYRVSGDLADVRPHLEGISSVLNWFERRREDKGRGVVGKLQYWCVMDWSLDWDPNGPEFGCPPGSYSEPSALYSFFHVWCLRMAANLHDACGARMPAPYREMADDLAKKAHEYFWSEADGAYRDCRSKTICSQMTNAFAILSGTAPSSLWPALAEKLVDPQLARAAYFGEHFVLRALGECGRFDLFYPRLSTYRDLIEKQCFATLPEDPVNQRSDCHGWSGGPAYHFLANGLGVKPLEPGFRKILIAPQPGPLKKLSGEVPTPQGKVHVDLALEGSTWRMKARTPSVPVVVRLPGQHEQTFDGGEITI